MERWTGRVALCASICMGALVLWGCDSTAPGVSVPPDDQGFAACGLPETGCPCNEGHVVSCYSESPLDDGQGGQYCLQGTRQCEGGLWSECRLGEGAVRHAIIGDPELCGGCDPTCFAVHDCPTQRDLNEDNANNVRFDLDANGIVLGGSLVNARYAYIANDPESTVSKIDLSTREEVGRYLVGTPGRTGWGGNRPSRSAIDARGDAYVASRAFGAQGTVTKIAGDESNCYDRDRDGRIDTSGGGGDVLGWGEDECVLWTANVGASNGVPRAVAVDRSGRIWVGLYNVNRFYVLDPEDGAVIRQVAMDISPYGAAIDGNGLLWSTTRCCGTRYIQAVDTETFTRQDRVYNPVCNDHYGIAVDTQGRVFVACAHHADYRLARYDPADGSWLGMRVASGYTRGVTIDAHNRVWVASHSSWWNSGTGWATSFDADTGADRHTYTLTGCNGPIGVGADFNDNMWFACCSSSNAARLDPDTGAVDLTRLGANNYTYSDFTGFLRATVTAPEGSYTRRHDSLLACENNTTPHWSQLYYEGETPPGTRIDFWARTANRTTDLGMATEVLLATLPGDASPADVQGVLVDEDIPNSQRYMEVRVSLHSIDGDSTPVFRNMNMVYYCVCSCDADDECSVGCSCDEDC